MSSFVPKTYQFILQRMVDRVVARSELTDIVTGSALWNVLASAARELDDAYFQMSNLQSVWDLDTATGSDLDLRAADIPDGQLVRRDAAPAACLVVFSRTGTTGAITIPAGTVVAVPGGAQYATSASGSIGNGDTDSSSLTVVAVEGGEDGNTAVDTITLIVGGVAGVETVTNTTAATGGSDEEIDNEFRERIRYYIRGLPRGTPDALKYAALGTEVDGYGRVTSCQIVTFMDNERGKVAVYIDDGQGTAFHVDDNYGDPEDVVVSAGGGERRMYLAQIPVNDDYTLSVSINGGADLVRGTDFRFDPTTGLIILDETAYPTGLTTGDDVTCEYTWYVGLITEVQKILNGDPADRANYPGYAAAGVQTFVLTPDVTQLAIECTITPNAGFRGSLTTLKDKVATAFTRYVNGLGVGDDVIYTELVYRAQSVPGVRDVVFATPIGNVTAGDGELIRVSTDNIDIT